MANGQVIISSGGLLGMDTTLTPVPPAALHRGGIFVAEKTGDEVIWEGTVELFALAGHETAKNCYAWQHVDSDGKTKILTVLESEFIDSARTAVQAAILTDHQPPRQTNTKGLKLFKKSLRQYDQVLRAAQIKTEDLNAAIHALKATGKILYRKKGNLPL
jgi:hypothetical protein